MEYDYPDFHLSMDCFCCVVKSGGLVLREHEAAKWLTREALDSVGLAAGRRGIDCPNQK